MFYHVFQQSLPFLFKTYVWKTVLLDVVRIYANAGGYNENERRSRFFPGEENSFSSDGQIIRFRAYDRLSNFEEKGIKLNIEKRVNFIIRFENSSDFLSGSICAPESRFYAWNKQNCSWKIERCITSKIAWVAQFGYCVAFLLRPQISCRRQNFTWRRGQLMDLSPYRE